MRVSIARIRLYLKTGKKLSDGTSPIMLMCSFSGRKEVSTGYSCIIKYWDKRNECIKKGYPNYVLVNQQLKKLKDDAIRKRDEYIASGEVYNPSMILSKDNELNAVTNDFKGLIQRYIDEKGLESRTIEKWWIVYRSIKRYKGRDILVNEIDEAFCRQYARWMESNGLSSGSIKSYLGKVGAICHYAIELGLMSKYPFSSWKYHKEYRESKSELYIHSKSMDVMIDILLDRMLIRDGELWSYRDGVLDELMDIHSSLYALFMYVIGYYMCGLAPVDISLLKKSDFKVIKLKGVLCYALDGRRSKTGMLYKIRLRQDNLLSGVLIRTMLMFNLSGDYFLPTLCGYEGNNYRKRVNNIYSYHSEHLVEWFRVVNEEIVKRNVNGENIPLIDLECRYYSYRHSYIMKEIQKPNVNLLALAQRVGKSSHTLHQYISLLGDVDLID